MFILIAVLLVLPVLGAQMGVNLNLLPHLITGPVEAIIRAIVQLSGTEAIIRAIIRLTGSA